MTRSTLSIDIFWRACRVRPWFLIGGLALVLCSCSANRYGNELAAIEGVYLPEQIDDPLEPLNRGVWAINHGLLEGLISPAGQGYRALVPTKARKSIRNLGYNLGYPGRALNQILQGRIGDAGEESTRFVCNTTVGLLGLFDVASKWDIPKHKGNFAQTFQKWGWDGQTYVMLPVLGPSDESHAVGSGMDRLADPLTYHRQARLATYGVRFNDFSEGSDEALRLIKSDPDAYSTIKYYWTYASKSHAPDWSLHGSRHAASLETLGVTTLRLRDPGFLDREREAQVQLPTTGRKLAFNYWLQDAQAPLVYVVPGLGSHRLAMQALSVAEGLYDRGFSVVTVSGLFHPEFIRNASTVKVPGYASADRKDLLAALTEVDAWLERNHGKQLGARGLVGCSMGGFQALALAASGNESPAGCPCACRSCGGGLRFERYVAVNPPVDLIHGMKQLDAYQSAPAEWPENLRQQRINNTLHKAVALSSQPKDLEGSLPPLDGVESKYLIGLAFRMTLRNAIFTSEYYHQLGNLKQPVSRWNRERVYHEILGISFGDYLKQIVLPHFEAQGVSGAAFHASSDLKRMAAGLAGCEQAHVITSRNDFLLSEGDIAWLQRTFGPQRLTLLEQGGHLGGLAVPAVHDRIAGVLESLKSR